MFSVLSFPVMNQIHAKSLKELPSSSVTSSKLNRIAVQRLLTRIRVVQTPSSDKPVSNQEIQSSRWFAIGSFFIAPIQWQLGHSRDRYAWWALSSPSSAESEVSNIVGG